MPLAVLTNLALLALRGDVARFVSPSNAIELAFTVLVVAPVAGAWLGHRLWRRGERRSGRDADAASFDAPAAAELRADDEQRRLSALRSQLEEMAARDPRRLARRTLLMTALGYGYVLLVVVALVVVVGWLVTRDGQFERLARQLGWIAATFGWFVLSALYIRVIAPKGRRVTRAGSPALFDAIDALCTRLAAPRPDVVLINADFNAAAAELPRFGIVGASRRYLVVGLPLLDAMSRVEAMAILAHEMAHLSERHVRRYLWVARLSATWSALAVSLSAGRHWGRLLFLPFSRWYAPRLELHARAVSRRDEHDSDALAASCVGPTVAARALVRLHVYGTLLQREVMPGIQRDSATRAEPPRDGVERISAGLRAGAPRDTLAAWTRAALADRTLGAHSHPSLADRIAAIGASVDDEGAIEALIDELAAAQTESGAEALIGAARAPKLRAALGTDWMAAHADAWRMLHADAGVWRAAMTDPSATPDPVALPDDALRAYARWAVACEPPDVAEHAARELLRRDPVTVDGRVLLGQLLADRGDATGRAEGSAMLEEVLGRDAGMALVAAAALEQHYARTGESDRLERVQTRARALREALVAGQAERRELHAADRMAPYALPEPSREVLRAACARDPRVRRAFLVRKETRALREQPCVMLVVEHHVPWYRPADGTAPTVMCGLLLQKVQLPETADLFVMPVLRRSALAARLRAMSGAEVYRRADLDGTA